jgi:diguanylate cyclase (GGDEF)-like protein
MLIRSNYSLTILILLLAGMTIVNVQKDVNMDGNENNFLDDKSSLFNDRVIALGRTKVVTVITLMAIVMAVAITYVLIQLFADDNFPILFVLKMATFISVIIAPVLAWPFVGTYFKSIHLERELYFMATYDMLTGLLSRNAFFSHLQVLHDIVARNKSPMSIACIDIDDFKKINDNYGHAAGDEVLKAFGVLIKNVVRKSDLVGRIGGDEFSLVLPYTGIAEARQLAENIRAIAANTQVNYGNVKIQFTLSIGISQADTLAPVLINEILVPSDKALYQAKQSGRNCVVMSAYPLAV